MSEEHYERAVVDPGAEVYDAVPLWEESSDGCFFFLASLLIVGVIAWLLIPHIRHHFHPTPPQNQPAYCDPTYYVCP